MTPLLRIKQYDNVELITRVESFENHVREMPNHIDQEFLAFLWEEVKIRKLHHINTKLMILAAQKDHEKMDSVCERMMAATKAA